MSKSSHKKTFKAAVWLLRVLIFAAVAAIGFLVVQKFVLPGIDRRAVSDSPYIVETGIVQDQPGHIIRIPGDEGAKIVIRELAHTYTVIGGYATISVPDYRFYENEESLPQELERVAVTLTPSLEGNKPMQPIVFDVEIPLSPIAVIQPRSVWSQVSTPVGTIQLKVTPGSKVIINGQDVSDTMDDDGVLTSTQPLQPIGDNVIAISVSAPHQRANNIALTFYKPPMEIPLELREDTGTRAFVNNKKVSTPPQEGELYYSIAAATLPGAKVTIETPYKNLDLSRIGDTGAFSFMPVFDKIGDNVVVIRASSPGKQDSVLEHTVYYMPPASEYSRTAWALDTTDYAELLNNIARRVEQRQQYLCQGRIIDIVSEVPQIAIMDTGKNGQEQLVMLENKSGDVWVLGEAYRVYADVSGLYDAMPRMYGRYTYPP